MDTGLSSYSPKRSSKPGCIPQLRCRRPAAGAHSGPPAAPAGRRCPPAPLFLQTAPPRLQAHKGQGAALKCGVAAGAAGPPGAARPPAATCSTAPCSALTRHSVLLNSLQLRDGGSGPLRQVATIIRSRLRRVADEKLPALHAWGHQSSECACERVMQDKGLDRPGQEQEQEQPAARSTPHPPRTWIAAASSADSCTPPTWKAHTLPAATVTLSDSTTCIAAAGSCCLPSGLSRLTRPVGAPGMLLLRPAAMAGPAAESRWKGDRRVPADGAEPAGPAATDPPPASTARGPWLGPLACGSPGELPGYQGQPVLVRHRVEVLRLLLLTCGICIWPWLVALAGRPSPPARGCQGRGKAAVRFRTAG